MKKCEFFKKELNFVGHHITGGGIEVQKEKIAALKQQKTPSTKQEVRAFLGLAGYYRRFIPNFATTAEPLTRLTKNVPFEWSEEQESAHRELIEQLTEAPVLAVADPTKKYILNTDASDVGLGAVLQQEDDLGNLHPLEYFSKTLNSTERNYTTYEKELMAIYCAATHWKHYIEGAELESLFKTDHAALKNIFTRKTAAKRVHRWIEELSMLGISIEYEKGTDNIVADELSRLMMIDSDWPRAYASLFKEGRIDPSLEVTSKQNDLIQQERKNFCLNEDGKICRTIRVLKDGKSKEKIVRFVPYVDRRAVIENNHKGLGHIGIDGTYNIIKDRYWWPNMRDAVVDVLKYCEECQLSSADRRPDYVYRPQKLPSGKLMKWSLDIVGPFPESESGNKYIITAIENITRWPVAKAVRKVEAVDVAQFLYDEIVIQYGVPSIIHTDNGTNFTSDTLDFYTKMLKTKHYLSTPYHPQSNGKLERFHGPLQKSITALTHEHPKRWDEFLNQALYPWRVKVNRITGHSPYYLMYGIEPRIPGDRPTLPPRKKNVNLILDDNNNNLKVIERIIKDANKLSESVETPPNRFKKDEYVLVKNMTKRKNQFKWKGPYKIVHVDPKTRVYKLAYPSGILLKTPLNEMLLRKANVRDIPTKMWYTNKTKQTFESLEDVI